MSKTVMTVKFADMPGRKFKVKEDFENGCWAEADLLPCAFRGLSECDVLRSTICDRGTNGYYFKEVLSK